MAVAASLSSGEFSAGLIYNKIMKLYVFFEEQVKADKSQWFERHRKRMKKCGFLWRKKRPYTEEELLHAYKYGWEADSWSLPPRFNIESKWEKTIARIKPIEVLCASILKENGDQEIRLTADDSTFIFNYEKMAEEWNS